MKSFILLLVCLCLSGLVLSSPNSNRIDKLSSTISAFWAECDKQLIVCYNNNYSKAACTSAYKTLLDGYCFSDVVTYYPEFAGPTPLIGTAAAAAVFGTVYWDLGSSGEWHIFGIPTITTGGDDDPGVVNFTTSGLTFARNRFMNTTWAFLDRKTHSFERRYGTWKFAAFDFSATASYPNGTNFWADWVVPRI